MGKAISEIKKELEQITLEELSACMAQYERDERKGVQAILASCQKKLEKEEKEQLRLDTMLKYERSYAAYQHICGIDEAGRGPLAGPVVAGAVILPVDCKIRYLNDSKKLSAARREELFDEIMDKAAAAAVGIVSPARIDEINILQATYEAMRHAVEDLDAVPDLLLNDAVTIPLIPIRQVGIVKGDARSLSIAAASIMAKVTRDRMMVEYAELYPEYGFEKNKGYGSAEHREALKKYGPCPIHRSTFIHNWIS